MPERLPFNVTQEQQDIPGLCIHGFDLPGSSELAAGTKIYSGGIEAIVEAVLDGSRKPLDFRWFVGRRYTYYVFNFSVACGRHAPLLGVAALN